MRGSYLVVATIASALALNACSGGTPAAPPANALSNSPAGTHQWIPGWRSRGFFV